MIVAGRVLFKGGGVNWGSRAGQRHEAALGRVGPRKSGGSARL